MDVVLDIVLDAVKDTLLLVPFLLATYLVMEWLEHKTSEAIRQSIGLALVLPVPLIDFFSEFFVYYYFVIIHLIFFSS